MVDVKFVEAENMHGGRVWIAISAIHCVQDCDGFVEIVYGPHDSTHDYEFSEMRARTTKRKWLATLRLCQGSTLENA